MGEQLGLFSITRGNLINMTKFRSNKSSNTLCALIAFNFRDLQIIISRTLDFNHVMLFKQAQLSLAQMLGHYVFTSEHTLLGSVLVLCTGGVHPLKNGSASLA